MKLIGKLMILWSFAPVGLASPSESKSVCVYACHGFAEGVSQGCEKFGGTLESGLKLKFKDRKTVQTIEGWARAKICALPTQNDDQKKAARFTINDVENTLVGGGKMSLTFSAGMVSGEQHGKAGLRLNRAI